MWFGQSPSLSHLCEIGCRAFALIQTYNPKIYQRSTPCMFIGYAPHSKAYHLWDNTIGTIFNSFHVTFIEHLDSQPSNLLPGTTMLFEPNAAPSWDAPGPSPPLTSSEILPKHYTITSSSPFIPDTSSDSSNALDTPICLPVPCNNPIIPKLPPDPVPLPPRHSECLAAKLHHNASTLLASFSPLLHSHNLIPLSIPNSSPLVD